MTSSSHLTVPSGFADRFAGRGAGIEADNTIDGVLFDFLVAPGCTLLISVVAEENTGGISGGNGVHSLLRVMSKLSLPSSSAEKNIVDSVSGSDTDMSVQGMVMKAAGNVLASLKNDLAGLVLEKEAEEEVDQDTNSYGSLDDLTYSGMDISKDSRQGGQTSSTSTSLPTSPLTSTTSRMKPLSVSDIAPDESNGALLVMSMNVMTSTTNQYTFLCVL